MEVKTTSEKKYGVKAVRPCEGGGLVVIGDFAKPFSMKTLCALLQELGQCSERLGVARFFHKGFRVTLYRNGRVDVHRVESEDDAIRVLDEILPLIEGAFIS